MIPRYSRPAMAALWTEEAKLGRWLEVELEVCRAWAERGVIPADDLAAIEAAAGFSVERTQELERTTNHDVVAFLTDVAERVGPASRWIHYGMTSSDVLDTGLALAIRRSGELLFAEHQRVTDLAARHRLPAVFWNRLFVEVGGLLSYGIDINNQFHRGAIYVDKILKGAKPADLPVEQPTKFELVINLKTAKVLGITVPPSLLARADEVIE